MNTSQPISPNACLMPLSRAEAPRNGGACGQHVELMAKNQDLRFKARWRRVEVAFTQKMAPASARAFLQTPGRGNSMVFRAIFFWKFEDCCSRVSFSKCRRL